MFDIRFRRLVSVGIFALLCDLDTNAAGQNMRPATPLSLGTTIRVTFDRGEQKDYSMQIGPGTYYFLIDTRRADEESSNIQAKLQLLKSNGVIVEPNLVSVNEIGVVSRNVVRYVPSRPMAVRLRVSCETGPLIVWLIHRSGWRGSFYWTAPLALLIAIIWWWYVRDYPARHKGVNEEERRLIDSNRIASSDKRQKGIWKVALKNRDVLLLTLSYFCMNYVFYIFFSWLFYYLVDVRNFSKDQAGVMNSVFWIVGAAGAILGGFVCDRLVRKYGARLGYRLIPFWGLLLAAALLAIGAISTNPFWALSLFSLSFSLTQVTDSSYWAAAISIGDRQAAAAACGILNTGGNAVGGINGLLVPITAKYFGWTAAIATGSIFALVAAILMLFVRADKTIAVKT